MTERTYTGPLARGRIDGHPFTRGVPVDLPDEFAARLDDDPHWSGPKKAPAKKKTKTASLSVVIAGDNKATDPDPTPDPQGDEPAPQEP